MAFTPLLAAGSVITSSTRAGAYQLAAADAGTCVELNDAGPVTVPAHATVPFRIGQTIEIFQLGAAQVGVVGAGGVTLRSDGGLTHTAGQGATIGLRQRAIDDWVLSGDLA